MRLGVPRPTLPPRTVARSRLGGPGGLNATAAGPAAPAPELVDTLIGAAEGYFKTMLVLAASTGLRRGEIYGAKWQDVSDDARTITIRRSNIDGVLVAT